MEAKFQGGGVLRVERGVIEITPAIRVPAASLVDVSVDTGGRWLGRKGDGGSARVKLSWISPNNQKLTAKLSCALGSREAEALAAELNRARAIPVGSVDLPAPEPCPPGTMLRVVSSHGTTSFDGKVLAIPTGQGEHRITAGEISQLGVDPPTGDGGLTFWVRYGTTIPMSHVQASDAGDLARLVSAVEAARVAPSASS